MNPATCLGAVLCLFAGQEPGPAAPGQRFTAAVADYRAGRYEAAYAGFAAEAEARGRAAPAELLADLALAALRVQRASEAEAAARRLAAHAEPDQRAWGEFLLGNASWQRGQLAAAAALLADAEPFAWDLAERGLGNALASWCRAAELRPGWPEALRNAERAARRLAEVRQLRQAAAKQQTRSEPEPPPQKPPRPSQQPPEEQVPELTTIALAPTEVASLLERLREKQHEKRQARQAAQRANAAVGERDW
ncbi:MAG TPA: hypothetical protein VFZ65_12290 [Planctomycetota bacterium]|nr:hypothetical protein [Planctomycetota bacterium]